MKNDALCPILIHSNHATAIPWRAFCRGGTGFTSAYASAPPRRKTAAFAAARSTCAGPFSFSGLGRPRRVDSSAGWGRGCFLSEGAGTLVVVDAATGPVGPGSCHGLMAFPPRPALAGSVGAAGRRMPTQLSSPTSLDVEGAEEADEAPEEGPLLRGIEDPMVEDLPRAAATAVDRGGGVTDSADEGAGCDPMGRPVEAGAVGALTAPSFCSLAWRRWLTWIWDSSAAASAARCAWLVSRASRRATSSSRMVATAAAVGVSVFAPPTPVISPYGDGAVIASWLPAVQGDP